MLKNGVLKVYYDGECPFCSGYVKYINLRKTAEEIHLVNLRDTPEEAQKFLEKGFNVDEGMILDIDGNLYMGEQALIQIALVSTRNNLFNKINYQLFKNPKIAKILYPILRFIRNSTLFVLRKDKILS